MLEKDYKIVAINEDTPQGVEKDGSSIIVGRYGKMVQVKKQDVGRLKNKPT